MTYADKIRQATGIQDAMVMLAEGIDELLFKLPCKEQAWGDWQAQTTEALPAPHAWDDPRLHVQAHEDYIAQITSLQTRLLEATDPDEIRALEAKLRLLEEDGATPEQVIPDGKRLIVTSNDKEIVVDIPAPDGPRMQARAALATDWKIGPMLTPALTIEEAADAYAKGGPMWLYLYDRDAVMSMPADWRREFVADVMKDSPAQAQELARDILKDTNPIPVGGVPAGEGEWV